MKAVASHELVHDGQLVRYLLGLLSDDEAERVDQLSFSSDEVAWRLRIAEDDLVDAYVRGTLDAEAIERFESFYLSTARRRQKVTFARTFVAAIDRKSGSPDSPSLPRARTAPRSRTAWRLAAAAAMFLVAGLALREYLRLRTDLTVAQSVSAGLSNRARELERQLTDARQADAENARELESIRASGSAPASSPSLPAIALVLMPQTRSVGPIATIAVPDGANVVELELQLESNDFARYQALLKDPGTNRIVWSRDRITVRAGGDTPAVALSIPAGVLRSQHYSLELSGTNARGEAEVAGSYVFQVVRR
jgi:hypothetical protein